MKPLSTLALGVLALAMAFSFNAVAAPNTADDSSPGMQQPQAKKNLRPHSHMEEKIGVVAKAAPTVDDKPAVAKPDPWKDRSKHFHPRDGK